MNLINLEINELPPSVLKKYISDNPNSCLATLFHSNRLKIYKTHAKDIEKSKLYPSQTWASFNTGKSFSEHKCYWYSDPINSNFLIWNKLAKAKISVGIIGSLHSSKYPIDLFENNYYSFLIPDCFDDSINTKPNLYNNFQKLNNKLVADSSGIANLKDLIKQVFFNFKNIAIRPRSFGLSLYSIKMIFFIIKNVLLTRNKELLRACQFPLLSSIFLDLYKQRKPLYSTLFTNHLAANMHRYWYAYEPRGFKTNFKNADIYIKRNKNSFDISLKIIDDFIKKLLKLNKSKNTMIILSSSMGQEPNPYFEKKTFANYYGKITNMDIFLKELNYFLNNKHNIFIEMRYKRNMNPQYGFEIIKKVNFDLNYLVESIKDFSNFLDLEINIDLLGNSLTLTIDPVSDKKLQEKYTCDQANNKFKKYGFEFYKIDFFQSGTHSSEGVLAVINENNHFKKCFDLYKKEDDSINYLDFNKIILDFFNTNKK